MKKIVAFLLVIVLLAGIGSALAAGWTCPNCGRKGNESRFCPDCGTEMPEDKKQEKQDGPNAPEAHRSRSEDDRSSRDDDTETDYDIGDYVYFGHYEQDNNPANGAEPIRWLVIDADGDLLFLLSEKGLDMQRFNGSSNGEVWAGSLLRKWLNGTFLKAAFDADEQDAIQTTEVEDTKEHCYSPWNSVNRLGGITEDKIFLLSYLEMNTLVSKQDRFCEPSVSVIRKGAYTENHNGHKCCWYWLRTSAYKNNIIVISAEGAFDTCYLHHEYGVIRPALWVEADAVEP